MRRIINTLKTIRQEIRNSLNDTRVASPVVLNNNEEKVLSEIKNKGFYVISDFYSKEECGKIVNEIDVLINRYKTQIVVDQNDSDHRIWGADRVSPLISKFFTNEFINKIVRAHEKTTNIVGFTLAAKLEYKPGNLGSGAGWHRDWAVNKQIKAILYLSDVEEQNGPFQYIEGSHRHLSIIKDCFSGDFDFNQNRFENKEIEKLLSKNLGKLKTFTGKAGTLILVNTRGIHRGMPIEKDNRYALTDYFWSNMEIPKHLAEMMIRK